MPADRIILSGIQFYGYHGVNPEEKALGQSYIVDLTAEMDLTKPGRSDNLDDTVSYTRMYRLAREVMEGSSRNLLESLAQTLADRLLAELPIAAVQVTVKKPHPPVKGSAIDYAAVTLYRRRAGNPGGQ